MKFETSATTMLTTTCNAFVEEIVNGFSTHLTSRFVRLNAPQKGNRGKTEPSAVLAETAGDHAPLRLT